MRAGHLCPILHSRGRSGPGLLTLTFLDLLFARRGGPWFDPGSTGLSVAICLLVWRGYRVEYLVRRMSKKDVGPVPCTQNIHRQLELEDCLFIEGLFIEGLFIEGLFIEGL